MFGVAPTDRHRRIIGEDSDAAPGVIGRLAAELKAATEDLGRFETRTSGYTLVDATLRTRVMGLAGGSGRSVDLVISAQNRNFPGRSGPGQMYLASPLTVAASAVAGRIVEYDPASERERALV